MYIINNKKTFTHNIMFENFDKITYLNNEKRFSLFYYNSKYVLFT